LIAYLLSSLGYPQEVSKESSGFSCVLLAMIAILSNLSCTPGLLWDLPSWSWPFLALIAVLLVAQNRPFLSNLSGLIVGYSWVFVLRFKKIGQHEMLAIVIATVVLGFILWRDFGRRTGQG
jgi:hypothetical protein